MVRGETVRQGEKRKLAQSRRCFLVSHRIRPSHRESLKYLASLHPGYPFWSGQETERNAAKIERIARHRAAPRLGGIEHLGEIGDAECQAAHDLAFAPDKVEAAIG